MLKWATLTWSPSLTTTTMSNIYVTLTAALIIVATLTTAANGFRSSSETLNADNARKLFGGYRITPKHCRGTKTLPLTDPRANGPTICMFNHECAQRNGEVVGACMDGFLFGACCQIPNNHDVESTLINDAQNAYFQQHNQQHKVQQQQAISNPAAAQSYEAYGGDSLQQQSIEFQAIESGNKYHQQQEQQQVGVSEPENIDKVYQQLDSTNSYDKPQETNYQQVSSSSNTYSPSVSSSTISFAEVTPTISSSSSSTSFVNEQQQNEQQQQQESVQQHQLQQEPAMQEATSQQQAEQGSSSNLLSNEAHSQSSTSLELENDSNIQSNIEDSSSNAILENHPPPTVHVKKNKVKISSPSSPPQNDDFVMQALSTLAPGHEDDHISFTTEVPMKISSSLVDQGSSESSSFEEGSTQISLQLPEQPVRDQLVEAPMQQHQHQEQQQPQQQIKHQQHQQQQQNPELTQEMQHLQQTTTTSHQQQESTTAQRPSVSHNHNHLLLDGGEFTHSDITHPGADAVLLEDDLQFSTGYGPVPVYVESPGASEGTQSQYTTIKAPASEDKYVLVQTITNDQVNKKPSQSSAVNSPTTSSSITTHVDSIESIILQLNNTNAGPSYNVVSQQTPPYGYDATSTMGATGNFEQQAGYYDPTPTPTGSTTLRPLSVATTDQNDAVYFDEVETKRPEDYYVAEQNYPAPSQQTPTYEEPISSNNSPVSYDTVSDEKVEASNTYLQNEYPTPKPVIPSYSTSSEQNSGDSEAALEDHTMPESNYNDVNGGAHQTSEFNKMPATGIAYPVDMSYFEGEEGNILAASSNQKPAYQSPNSEKQPSNEYQNVPSQTEPEPTAVTYTRLPIVTESQPVATYIGMITAQNFNQNHQQPLLSVYNQVPEEVSISSHTTKVQSDDYNADSDTSPAYHTAAPEKLSTNSYAESSPSSYYISSTSTPVANRLSTSKPVIITASSTRPKPKPKPKPKPSSKRPTKRPTTGSSTSGGGKKPAKPQSNGGKNPNAQQPASAYNPTQQLANNYGEEVVQIKKPKPSNTFQDPQTSVYSHNTEPIYTKQPVAPAENNYLETLVSHDETPKPASGNYKPKPVKTKKPAVKPAQPTSSYHDPPELTSGYQELLPPHSYITESTYTKKPNVKPTNNYQAAKKPAPQPTNTFKKPAQQPTLSNSYDSVHQPISVYSQLEQGSKYSTQRPTQPSLTTYEQDSNLPNDPVNAHKQPQQQTKRPSQPLNSYNQPAQNNKQPSNTYNQDQQLLVTPTKRPTTRKPAITNKKPSSQHKPISTSFVTGPTSPRPPTTFGYHDDEVPPLLMADDKLDSFVHSTAEAVAIHNAGYPSTHAAPQSVYVSSVTPINVQHPAVNNYNQYKKPGFVKVQQPTIRPPVPTVLITPKPTVINLVTSSSWTQQTNGGIIANADNVYAQTTPIPGGFDSNSYVFSSMVTRRPEFASNVANTPEYVNLPAMNSNDFDDPGYYGAHHVTNPTYTQPTTEPTYAVPSDDRPAFPGYYGPTPTYPAFQVPGEKLGAPIEDDAFTSSNDFVNFPPVRNPNLNMSATSSAVTSDLELSTPAFVEDIILKDKMNTLVHKIVESLQGNFDALADMIDDPNNTAPASTYQAGGGGGATTVPKKPTRKPTRVTVTTKPKATTKKPITRVTTKRPATVTTRKPVSRRTTTTRKPVTRKPTKRITTTTIAPVADDEIVDEEDEEDVNPSDNEIDLTETVNNSEGGGAGAGAGAGADNNAGGRRFQCGIRPHVKSGRIVGGKGSTFGEFPWQVLVRESTWLGLFTKNKCGGVLITSRYVITAAHCQPGFLASLVAVMGEYDISGDLESKRAVTKNVKRVIVHRQYDPATFENDLALLELESSVQFDSHIVPICMPSDTADFTGRMATVTGWGRLKYGGGVPSVLQEVQVPVIENSVCQEMFHTAGHNKKILNSFLCAGYANGQKDSCEGDSGGPLVLQRTDGRYELAGTVSHGIKCAAPYLPGVYMRTTYYKPWLRSITGVK